MEATTINKYQNRSTAWLKAKAQQKFNSYIRQRDKDLKCVSCGKGEVEQASHFYSSGHFKHMTFNEDNVHGSCLRCNYFLAGNLIEYRKGLEKKIGTERLNELDRLSKDRSVKPVNRFLLIEIIERYSPKSNRKVKAEK